jgi:hypothetical protein
MTQNAVETIEDFGKPPENVAKRWIAELDLYNDQSDRFWRQGENILKRYRDEDRDTLIGAAPVTRRYNMLWANIEVQKPILYARLPKADVQRRFKDNDPVGRLACEVAERALDYGIQCTDRFDRVMKDCTEDLLLVAQGVSWQRYVPHFKETTPRIDVTPVSASVSETIEPEGIAADGVQVTNDSRQNEPTNDYKYADNSGKEYGLDQLNKDDNGYYVNGEPVEVVDYEEVVDDYVYFSDWGCNAGARTWDEVYAVWRRVFMTKDELVDRFGEEVAQDIPLDYEPKGMDKQTEEVKELFKKATIYEIWDRSTRKVYWISKGYSQGSLDERDDPLGLEDFFPCPRPMWMTQTNNLLTPIPDYVFYQDQDAEIQSLTARIAVVEEAIRVRGIYPANIESVKQLLTEGGTNDMIPMDYNVLATLKMSDMKNMIFFWPIEQIVSALKSMIEMRNQLIQDVYQITGLSDVLRGQGDPDETATGQELKAQYGGLRVREKQKEVQRFARDMLRIRFEIIFNHFEPSTIWLMTNAQSIPDVAKDPTRGQPVLDQMGMPTGEINEYGDLFNQAMGLLRNKALRMFRVDIETDSTVAADENMEKQRVNELLTAVGGFMGQIGETVIAAPEFAAPMGELMMYAFRRYKAGNTLESAMETAIEAFTQRLSQPQPQQTPQPTPDKLIDAEIKKAELQQKGQLEQGRLQFDVAKGQTEAQLEQERVMNERASLALQAEAMRRDPGPQSVQ